MNKLVLECKNFITFAVICFLYYYCSFYYPYSFNREFDHVEHYNILPLVGTVLILNVIVNRICGAVYRISAITAFHLLVIFVLNLLQALQIEGFYSGNEYLMFLIIFLECLFLLYDLKRENLDLPLIFFISLIFIYQLYLAINQIIAKPTTLRYDEVVTGTFQNSGAFACYLTVTLPILGFALWHLRAKICLKVITWTLTVMGMIAVLILTNSRTGILTNIAVTVSLFSWHYKKQITDKVKRHRRISLIIAMSTFISGIFFLNYLYETKVQSALGRWLIWQVASEHISKKPLFGHGTGMFPYYYPLWQGEYISKHYQLLDGYQFLNAGESFLAFNEYLQLCTENGILGAIVLGLLICFLIRAIKKRTGLQVYFLVASLLGFFLFGLTSYPFHQTIPMFTFTLIFGVVTYPLIYYNWVINVRTHFFWLVMAFMLIINIRQWSDLFILKSFEQFEEKQINSKQDLAHWLPKKMRRFAQDGKILFRLGSKLITVPALADSGIRVLEAAKQYSTSYINYEYCGEYYIANKDYNNAISNYRFLTCLVPSKFRPKLELLRIYQTTADTANGRIIANEILKMPVKIPSTDVDLIRLEATEYLNKISSRH